MKYYYEKPEDWVNAGQIVSCSHPMFSRATLFRTGEKGLLVIQERFNEKTKARWWGPIEPWIAGDLYAHPDFAEVFDRFAKEKNAEGLFPAIKLRKLMWELRMKPLKKEYWEEF